jgi:hypothetical protein
MPPTVICNRKTIDRGLGRPGRKAHTGVRAVPGAAIPLLATRILGIDGLTGWVMKATHGHVTLFRRIIVANIKCWRVAEQFDLWKADKMTTGTAMSPRMWLQSG